MYLVTTLASPLRLDVGGCWVNTSCLAVLCFYLLVYIQWFHDGQFRQQFLVSFCVAAPSDTTSVCRFNFSLIHCTVYTYLL